MPELQSFNDILAWVLGRANEETDGTSDWATDATTAIVDKHRNLIGRYPWMCLEKHPPGVVLVPAVITDITITVTAGSTAGTFGGVAGSYASSLTGYKIVPTGKDYVIRVTAHTAAAAAFTADACPETLSAVASEIYKDEVDLPSDFHLFVNCCWTHGGEPIRVVNDERLRRDYPEPRVGASWPPAVAARIGLTKLRFATYPDARKRVEIPYTYDPGDPSGSSELTIEDYLRPVLAQMVLPVVLRLKKAEQEAVTAEALAERMIALAIDREDRLRRSIYGDLSGETRRSPWE